MASYEGILTVYLYHFFQVGEEQADQLGRNPRLLVHGHVEQVLHHLEVAHMVTFRVEQFCGHTNTNTEVSLADSQKCNALIMYKPHT